MVMHKRQPVIDVHALAPGDIDEARDLLRAYQTELGSDVCFEHLDQEIAQLPGAYSPPAGTFFLARVDGLAAGCCGFQPLPLSDHLNACEMKRLFVRPHFRGMGLGRRLVEAVLTQAPIAGYSTVLLDTLSDMETARDLYQSLGFVHTEPYHLSPIPGAHYLKRTL